MARRAARNEGGGREGDDEPRRTGIDVVGPVPWGTHFCQFYETKQDLVEVLVPYLQRGLADDEFCMWVTSEPLGRDEAELTLREAVPDLDDRLRRRQIEILDYSQWYTRTGSFEADRVLQGWVDKLNDALRRGYSGLRLTGNTFWLKKADWAAFTAYEETVNNVIGKHRMLAFCTYALEKCGATEILDVVANHQFAMIKREGRWELIESSRHRQVAEALRQSRRDLQAAQGVAHVGSWRMDVLHNELTWSDENHRMFGIPKGTPMTYETFLDAVHPEDRDYVDGRWQAALRGEPYDIEHRILVDGQVKWVREKAYLEFDGAGTLLGGFGITQDVTDRKRAEEKLRRGKELSEALNRLDVALHATLDSGEIMQRLLAEGVAVLGSDTGAVSLRRGNGWVVSHVHGMPAELIGAWMSDREKMHAVRAIESGEPVAVADVLADEQVNREHLRRYNVRAVVVAPLIARGEPLGAIFFNYRSAARPFAEEELSYVRQLAAVASSALENARLFGERRQAERALKSLNETLEERVAQRTAEVERQAEQLRALASQLSQTEQRERKRLARVLHDHIQQILVAARMQLARVDRDIDREQMRAVAGEVDEILREAIDASRSLAVDLSPPVLHEAGLVGGLTWLASRMQDTNQLTVRLRANASAEPASEETRFLLFECVRELLFNTVKHAGVSKADVALLRTKDGLIRIMVRDEGRGFEPELIEERRSDQAMFGLFSIQERLAHIGGRMDVETAPGKGTKVTLTAPQGGTEPSGEVAREKGQPTEATHTVRTHRKTDACRVLIVDDHKLMREGLAQLFEFESDIEVVGEAADGQQAIELARKLEPDVIIMDVNLNGMSGLEATQRILTNDPRRKVIGLSMHVNGGVASAMRAAGAIAYLTKDGPSEELIAAVRACRSV